jgi:hypothetical protein
LRKDFSKGRFTKYGLHLYELLIRTIEFRSISFFDRKRQEQIGLTKRKLRIVFEEDKEFIDLALAENRDALTPLFPGDLSTWQIIVPGFS